MSLKLISRKQSAYRIVSEAQKYIQRQVLHRTSSASSIVTFFLPCHEFSFSGALTANKRPGHETRTNQRPGDLFSGWRLTFLVSETQLPGSGSSISGVSVSIVYLVTRLRMTFQSCNVTIARVFGPGPDQ